MLLLTVLAAIEFRKDRGVGAIRLGRRDESGGTAVEDDAVSIGDVAGVA